MDSWRRLTLGILGLEIRHPLRGLGVQIIDSKSILPVAGYNRLQFWDTTLTGRRLKAWLTPGMVSLEFTLERAKILCSLKAEL